MSEEYFSYIMLALAGFAIIAVLWGLLGIVRGRRNDAPSVPQDSGKLGEILRAENDRVKTFLEHHGKVLRQEIGETVNGLKETAAQSISELQQSLNARMDGLGHDLDARVKALDERQSASVVQADGSVMHVMPGISDETAQRQAAALGELRQEFTAGLERLQERLASSAQEQRAAQAEQMEAIASRVAPPPAQPAELQATDELRRELSRSIERLQESMIASAIEQRNAQATQIEALAARVAAATDAARPALPDPAPTLELRQEFAASIDRLQERLIAGLDEQRAAHARQMEALAARVASLADANPAATAESALAGNLRQELASSIERLQERMAATAQEQRAVQAEQIEMLANRIAAATEGRDFRAAEPAATGEAVDPAALRQELKDAMERLQERLMNAVQEQRSSHAEALDALASRVSASVEAGRPKDDVGERLSRLLDDQRAAQSRQLEEVVQRIAATVSDAGKGGEQVKGVLDSSLAELSSAEDARHRALLDTLDSRLKELADGSVKSVAATQQETAAELARIGNTAKDTLTAMTALRTQRVDSVATSLKTLTERQEKTQETLRRSIEAKLEAIGAANNARLEEMQSTVERQLRTLLDERIGNSVRLLDAQFEQLRNSLGDMQALTGDFGDLKRALTGARTQGVLGAVDLRDLVSQMFTADQYVIDAQVGERSDNRADVAIRVPGRNGEGQMLLPILGSFRAAEHAELTQAVARNDAAAADAAGHRLEAALRAYARDIAERFVNPPETADIAMLYLSSEALYAEVLRRPGLVEQIQHQSRVVIAGPTTLQAMLNAFRMVIRAVAIQKRSTEVWQLLGTVRTELDSNSGDLAQLQQQLAATLETVDAVRGRAGNLRRKLQGLDTIGKDHVPTLLGLTPGLQEAAE